MSSYPPPPFPPTGYPPGAYPPPGLPPVPPPASKEPRRYGLWRGMFLCLSPNVWRDVGQRWPGAGLTVVFLVLFLTWLVSFIRIEIGYSNFVANDSQKLVSQVPKITITNGVVTCDRPQPYVIRDPDTGAPLVIVDTTGKTVEPPKPAFALLTKDAVITRDAQGMIKKMPLDGVKSFYLDQARVSGWLQDLKGWLPVFFGVLLVFAWLARLLQLLIYAGIGQALASNFRARLTYGGAMRLTAIAIIPVAVLTTVLDLLHVPGLGCGGWALERILEFVILVFAIKANGGPKPLPFAGYSQAQWPPGTMPPG